MENKKEGTPSKGKLKKFGAALCGTVCSAVMLVGGAALMTGCDTNPDNLRGKSAYELYLDTVPEGETPMTLTEWLASLKGDRGFQGENPYDMAIRLGLFTGTEEEFLASLKGEQGVGIKTLKYAEDETGAYILITYTNNTTQKMYINRVVASQEDFIAALQDETTTAISVAGDVSISEDVDLSGKEIYVGGSLTFDGGTGATPTNINLSNANISLEGGELIVSNANLVVESGKSLEITGSGGAEISIDDDCSLVVKDGAAMTIEGATINSDIAVQADATANVEINNCVINGDFSIETTATPVNNQSNGSANINGIMLLGPDDANTQTVGLLPAIVLENVSFQGDVTISSDLDVNLKSCNINSSKTMTVTKGNIVLTGISTQLLSYLALSPAQGATATVDIYVSDGNGLEAAGAFDSEFKTVYLADDINASTINIATDTLVNGQGYDIRVNSLTWNDGVTFNVTDLEIYTGVTTEAYLKSLLTLNATAINVQLINDITLTESLQVTQNLNIDGQNYKILGVFANNTAIKITKAVAFRAMNLEIVGDNDYTYANSAGWSWGIQYVKTGAKVEMQNCTIRGYRYCLGTNSLINNAEITLVGCELSGWAAIATYSSGSVYNITGSILTGTNAFNGTSNIFGTITLWATVWQDANDETIINTAGASNNQFNIENSTINAVSSGDTNQSAIAVYGKTGYGEVAQASNNTFKLKNVTITPTGTHSSGISDVGKNNIWLEYDDTEQDYVAFSTQDVIVSWDSYAVECGLENGLNWYGNLIIAAGDQIDLTSDVVLTGDVVCRSATGTYLLNLNGYTITGGQIELSAINHKFKTDTDNIEAYFKSGVAGYVVTKEVVQEGDNTYYTYSLIAE
ncbi:MAG: hypothetical protein IJU58_00255 [Clostridia bacterium]|nr:hypothetical protein [Clostridia bacterium]